MGAEKSAATVALIRGNALNPSDTQQFPHGDGGISMLAIGSRQGARSTEPIGLPVRRLPQLGEGLPGRVQTAIERAPGLAVGPDTLLGLTSAVRHCRILHAAETFQVNSVQAAIIRLRHPDRRLVLTVWENIPFNWEDGGKVSARKALVRRVTDAFVAVTEQARDALVAEGVSPGRIVVRAPGIRGDGFSPSRRSADAFRSFGIPKDAKVVLYVGRLIREKGIVDLMMAVAKLPADTHLVLAGTGADRPRLEIAAAQLGIRCRVHFADGIDYTDVGRLMASCDVLAVPSLTTTYWLEQFGLVLAEAMRSGAPIVAYASGAIPEVVGDAARLVAPYDHAGLARALDEVLTDRTTAGRLAQAGLARAAALFDAEMTAAWWTRFYTGLLASV